MNKKWWLCLLKTIRELINRWRLMKKQQMNCTINECYFIDSIYSLSLSWIYAYRFRKQNQ